MEIKIYFSNNEKIYYYFIKSDKDLDNNSFVNLLEIENKIEDKYILENFDFKNKLHIGPHYNFVSSFSTNVINILQRIGINSISKFDLVKIYDVNSNNYIDEMLEIDYNKDNKIETINYPAVINFDNLLLNKYGIHFDKEELNLYKKLYKKLNRKPTLIELYDLCQSNSEHSRHWFFGGKLIDSKNKNVYQSLFPMIKSTLIEPNNSLVAFSDNSSIIKGFTTNILVSNENNKIKNLEKKIDLVFTAETHNFPTLISPFQGASTGIGGRIRDNHATGKGSYLIAGTAGYCVGELNFDKNINDEKYGYNSPLKILIEASNGASDYGNKIGEPIINGFTRSFGMEINNEHIEWIKPIMFTGGIGSIQNEHIYKSKPEKEMIVVRIGGPAYKIGLGGGFSSSLNQDGTRKQFDLSAVQRGDPQMENKLNRVIKSLIDLGEFNPIISIHDQGAGGLANVVKEIVYPNGAEIYLDKITLGDKSLHPLEIWCSEFQESDVLLCKKSNLEIIEKVCKRENVICDKIGFITDTKNIIVKYKSNIIVNLPLKDILEPNIKKEYILNCYTNYCDKGNYLNEPIEIILEKILKCPDVGSKRFLTNKVDRSVTGLIAQQQCIGPFHTPLSNYCAVAISYFDKFGIASSIGEKPILGLIDTKAQGSMSVCEMITNMMGIYIEDISNIKCSGNWMWSIKSDGENKKLYETAQEMCKALKELNIGIDGGKDSLSMCVKYKNKLIKSPGNIVISGYSSCPNITKKLTPNFKKNNSYLLFIDFAEGKMRLGGSIFLRLYNQLGNKAPNINNYKKLKNTFNLIQKLIFNDKILSLHDKSDGGFITTLCEMSLSSNIGFKLNLKEKNIYEYLFNEELGIILEIDEINLDFICNKLDIIDINYTLIGKTSNKDYISIINFEKEILNLNINKISEYWEYTSYNLEKYQANNICIEEEYKQNREIQDFYLPKNLYDFCKCNLQKNYFKQSVAIIRDEGSNGDKEMCAVFKYIGFETFDIHMNDLIENPKLINNFRGLVYVGGFSHSDVLGAAHGWYLTIKNNKKLKYELDLFMKKDNTFSLGICNGCQLMVKQKIFSNNLKLVKNNSNRFESRFINVKIVRDDNIFFKNMKNMNFGIWIAHGEGKFINTNELEDKQKVLHYVYNNEITQKYPYNPNGSENGIAGIVSKNGRHLAMMPHPERCFLKWQLPYLNKYNDIETSPWLFMFKNIYEWVTN